MEWTVGIDWGSEAHQVEIHSQEDGLEKNVGYSADVTGLFELRDELLEEAAEPKQVKVGIEDPTRPVVRLLLDAGMEVFILNPRKVDSLRPVYADSDKKSDELDAHVLCEELRVHPNVFYKLVPNPPVIAALSQCYRAMEDAKSDVTRFSNRLREKLRYFFPRFLELDWTLTSRVMLDLLELIPRPSAVGAVSVEEVDEVLGRCRKHSAQEVLEILGAQSPPLADRIVEATAAVASNQVQKLQFALQEEQRWYEEIESLLEEISDRQKSGELPSAASAEGSGATSSDQPAGQQPQQTDRPDDQPVSDVEIALSTRGIGIRTAAGLFAEGFQALADLNRDMLRRQSIAPVTKQTGKQSSGGDGSDPLVHRRYARNRTLNDTMHQLGDSLQRQNAHYRARYVVMKNEKNHTHGRACRQLTDQYLRVLFAMLRDRTMYDAELHGATRR